MQRLRSILRIFQPGQKSHSRGALPRDPASDNINGSMAKRRGRDTLPRDPGVRVSNLFFSLLPCELPHGYMECLPIHFIGPARPDRAGARP